MTPFILMDSENKILEEIADKRMKRLDIALTYRLVMVAEQNGEKIEWYKINQAIINRWSISGLQWIKNFAWNEKLVRP